MLTETEPLPPRIGDPLHERLEQGLLSFAVVRRAGAAALKLQRLKFDETVSTLDTWLDMRESNSAGRGRIVELLEGIIGQIPRGAPRMELVHLKRDIFNGRLPGFPLTQDTQLELNQHLAPGEESLLNNWIRTKRELDALAKRLDETFARELSASEKQLRAICRNKVFRCGLEYSSPALSQDIEKYLAKPESFAGAKKARIHRSILHYYARTSLKLSPFSTFMRSRIVRFSGGPDTLQVRSRVGMERSVGLNRTFIAHLAHSLALHPELHRYVPVVPNQSIVKMGTRLVMMRHEYRDRWSRRLRIPNESLVELPDHGMLAPLIDLLERADSPVFPVELARTLGSEFGGEERVLSMIETLISMDFLKRRVPLPEDDSPAVQSLLKYLSSVAHRDPRLADLRQEVEHLTILVDSLQQSPPQKVRILLNQIDSASGKIHAAIGDHAAPDWAGNLIFENTVEEPVGEISIPRRWLAAATDLRHFLASFVPLLDLNSCIRESMRFVLEREFLGTPVPFLQFAARYRKLLKTYSPDGKDREYNRNPFQLPSLVELQRIWQEIGTRFLGETDGSDFDLRAAESETGWAERFNALAIARPAEGVLPITCFIQPCLLENDRAGFVVNSIGAGPCGALLRACCGLRDQRARSTVLAALQREIESIWRTAEPCELRATFDFNPNLCPVLTRRSINYMSDPAAKGNTISVGALRIGLSDTRDLRLTCNGRDIAPVGFGALARQLHPPIARLLLALGGAEPVDYARLSGREVELSAPGRRLSAQRSQRFTYGQCIIRRQGWYFPPNSLPKHSKSEGGIACFTAIRKWQREMALPDEGFVRTRVRGAPVQPGHEKSGNQSRSFMERKPQYVNFRNYFFAESFADLIEERDKGIHCEEALPRPTHWAQMGISRPIEIAVDVCVDSSAASAAQLQQPLRAEKAVVCNDPKS